MARIKSALELAMERTQDVQGDRTKLDEYEERQRGRKVYAQLLANPELDIRKALQDTEQKNKSWAEEGFFEAIISNVSLPNDTADVERLALLKRGLEAVIKDRKIGTLFSQLEQFFGQYLNNKNQLIEALRQQFEGRLKQKEDELSRQMGRRVRLDPASDPEFTQALKANLGRLQAQYGRTMDQVRADITTMWEKRR